jgi:hypothetical protein
MLIRSMKTSVGTGERPLATWLQLIVGGVLFLGEIIFAMFRLAKLLIWESHVNLLYGSPHSRVYEIAKNETLVLPFLSVNHRLQAAMLGAAVEHGTASAQYRAARERVIAELSQQ